MPVTRHASEIDRLRQELNLLHEEIRSPGRVTSYAHNSLISSRPSSTMFRPSGTGLEDRVVRDFRPSDRKGEDGRATGLTLHRGRRSIPARRQKED